MSKSKQRRICDYILYKGLVRAVARAKIACNSIIWREALKDSEFRKRLKQDLSEMTMPDVWKLQDDKNLPEALRSSVREAKQLLERLETDRNALAATPAGLLAQQIEKDFEEVQKKIQKLARLLQIENI
jgi:hypothetical protein